MHFLCLPCGIPRILRLFHCTPRYNFQELKLARLSLPSLPNKQFLLLLPRSDCALLMMHGTRMLFSLSPSLPLSLSLHMLNPQREEHSLESQRSRGKARRRMERSSPALRRRPWVEGLGFMF